MSSFEVARDVFSKVGVDGERHLLQVMCMLQGGTTTCQIPNLLYDPNLYIISPHSNLRHVPMNFVLAKLPFPKYMGILLLHTRHRIRCSLLQTPYLDLINGVVLNLGERCWVPNKSPLKKHRRFATRTSLRAKANLNLS